MPSSSSVPLTASELLAGIAESLALLEERGARPSRVELTQSQFDLLKENAAEYLVADSPAEDSLFGLKVVIHA